MKYPPPQKKKGIQWWKSIRKHFGNSDAGWKQTQEVPQQPVVYSVVPLTPYTTTPRGHSFFFKGVGGGVGMGVGRVGGDEKFLLCHLLSRAAAVAATAAAVAVVVLNRHRLRMKATASTEETTTVRYWQSVGRLRGSSCCCYYCCCYLCCYYSCYYPMNLLLHHRCRPGGAA